MLGATSLRQVASRRAGSPNGTAPRGALWARGLLELVITTWMLWQCRAATSTRAACSRRRAGARPLTLPNGTAAVGARLDQEWMVLCARWQCQAVTCMRAAFSARRVASRRAGLPNGTAVFGARLDPGSVVPALPQGCMPLPYSEPISMRGDISPARGGPRP